MKHKHYEFIVAWAAGKKIQFKNNDSEVWNNLGTNTPAWHNDVDYRIKPEPFICEKYLLVFENNRFMITEQRQWSVPATMLMQLKLTYKDDVLQSSEVIK